MTRAEWEHWMAYRPDLMPSGFWVENAEGNVEVYPIPQEGTIRVHQAEVVAA